MHIAAFSKYLAYSIGGAEASTRDLLVKEAEQGNEVTLISQANARFLGHAVPAADLPPGWKVKYIQGGMQLPRFSHIEYLLNRKRVATWFSHSHAHELWTYGTWAPAAIQGFQGPVRYFVRSETDLGIFGNYFYGLRYRAKKIYSLVEAPAARIYRRDLSLAIRRASVVANSKYMAARALQLFGVDAEVWYPPINVDSFRARLEQASEKPKWVVFVGDGSIKGINHILAAARQLPDVPFRIVSRLVQKPRQENNILWTPWEKEAWRVYSGARLVVVPSQWEEAYGRVAREAYLLGIPVLVSAVGGLPEAVDNQPEHLVHEFRSADAWAYAIRESFDSV